MTIEVRRLTGGMGAEIFGIDLSHKITPDLWQQIRSALSEHQAIFFPQQTMGPENIIAFMERLGTPMIHPYLNTVNKDYPFVHELRKTPTEVQNYGGAWHLDWAFIEKPGAANSLYSRVSPDFGGDTMFCNLYQAYDALSDGLKKVFDGVKLLNSATAYKDFMKTASVARDDAYENMKDLPSYVAHPLFRTIPETGRKCLFLDPCAAFRFEDMTFEESRPILTYLISHLQRPEFQFRYRWKPDVFGVWDNRCLVHYALNDYPGQLRVMHRMTVQDTERPR